MMRLVGFFSTAVLIFTVGCGAGAYYMAKFAYIEGAKEAFRRCPQIQGGDLETWYR